MRILIMVMLALGLIACGDVTVKTAQTGETSVDVSGHVKGGWSAKVLGSDAERVFIVSRPDGMQVAARAKDGKSEIVDAGEARAAFSEKQAAIAADAKSGGEKVAIKVPGLEVNVKGDEGENGPADVKIKAGGASISVAAEDGPGGQAAVDIGGIDADAARKFIDDAEELSPEVKAQMKQKLGL